MKKKYIHPTLLVIALPAATALLSYSVNDLLDGGTDTIGDGTEPTRFEELEELLQL